MKKITQTLFLLAIVIILLAVTITVLRQSPRESTISQTGFPKKLQKAESIEKTEIKEDKTGKEEVSRENQKENKEEVERLPQTKWEWVESQRKLYKLTSAEVDIILKKLQELFPNKAERLKALSILRLGTPYQFGGLGEESGRDKDPIFRLDVTDCTAFVLTNVALLHSQTTEEARNMMKYLNYRSQKDPKTGKLIYPTTFERRLHFTTDRNKTSPYFKDVTKESICGCKLKTKSLVLNKIKLDGKRLIDINWEKRTTMNYIPSEFITKEFLQSLPNALGIAFVKNGDEKIGLDVRHEGFLLDRDILFHASSLQKKVVAVNFLKYYFKKDNHTPRFDGIILFEIK